MILGALRVLKNESVRKYWQERIFAVFEDEAQDSTPLQSKLLRILASSFVKNSDDLSSPLETLNLAIAIISDNFHINPQLFLKSHNHQEFVQQCALNLPALILNF